MGAVVVPEQSLESPGGPDDSCCAARQIQMPDGSTFWSGESVAGWRSIYRRQVNSERIAGWSVNVIGMDKSDDLEALALGSASTEGRQNPQNA